LQDAERVVRRQAGDGHHGERGGTHESDYTGDPAIAGGLGDVR
jgi:hypothetical protein